MTDEEAIMEFQRMRATLARDLYLVYVGRHLNETRDLRQYRYLAEEAYRASCVFFEMAEETGAVMLEGRKAKQNG